MPEFKNQNESAEVQNELSKVEDAARKNPEAGKVFDEKQERYSEQEYEGLKKEVIKNIINWKINKDYLTVDPNNTEYQNKVFVSENPTLVKGYLAYYNSQQLEAQLRGKITTASLIDIDKFMNNFAEVQLSLKNKTIPQTAKFETQDQTQIVGEFPVDRDHIKKIDQGVTDIVNSGQYIEKLIIRGNADATRITELGKERVKEAFIGYRNILIAKGWTKNLPDEHLLDNEDQNTLNTGYARTRALMQLAFLDQDKLNYLRDNSGNVVFDINPQIVGGEKKGDIYTGGGIEMEVKGGANVINHLTEEKNAVLKMIDVRTINYAVRATMPQSTQPSYNTVGTISVGMNNGELSVSHEDQPNDFASIYARHHPFAAGAENQPVFLDQNNKVNTMWIMIDATDPRINKAGGMNNLESNMQAFSQALNEYASKSPDAGVKTYAQQTQTLLNVYQEVDKQLQDAKKTKKISL